MFIATIDEQGTQYAFTDSGHIHDQDYQTLITYHGTAFNAESFEPLVPLFREKNVRVINVSRRSYGKTTPHSATDIANLASGHQDFLRVLARDVANFLVWVIDNLGPFAEKSLALLSWSMGTSTTLALLGQRDAVPEATYNKLEPYLNKFIIHDAPLTAYGFDFPELNDEEFYNPFFDVSFSDPMEYGANIQMQLSMHFAHPDFGSRKISGLVGSRASGAHASLARLSPEEANHIQDFGPIQTGADAGAAPYMLIQTMLREQANRALFGEDNVLPKVSVTTIGCVKTHWFLAWGFFESERRYKEVKEKGKQSREMSFIDFRDANHFIHVEFPQVFVNTVVEALR